MFHLDVHKHKILVVRNVATILPCSAVHLTPRLRETPKMSRLGKALLSTLRFKVLHNDPAAHQNHCVRCRIRTQNWYCSAVCMARNKLYLWCNAGEGERLPAGEQEGKVWLRIFRGIQSGLLTLSRPSLAIYHRPSPVVYTYPSLAINPLIPLPCICLST